MDLDRLRKGLYWDRAWSLVNGCSPVSPGCDHCWAARESWRFSRHPNSKISERHRGLTSKDGGWTCKVRLRPDLLEAPLKVRRPTVWAVWTDLFHPDVPTDFIVRVFGTVARCPQHTFLILTKRSVRMFDVVSILPRRAGLNAAGMPQLWLGATMEDPIRAAERAPAFYAIQASHKWISAEPLLGKFWPSIKSVDWVVCGGESGPHARPMNCDWARHLLTWCKVSDVPFFFKQWGEFCPPSQMPEDTFRAFDVSHGTENWDRDRPWRVGKDAAGRLLDGKEYLELPWAPNRIQP